MLQRFLRIIRWTLVIALMSSVYAACTPKTAPGLKEKFGLAFKFKETSELAEQGDAIAQLALGYMYESGEGVAEDDKQAVYWWTKAAEQGFDAAQYTLGHTYYIGEGVAEDYVMAHMWWNIAAANGHESARANKDILVKKMSPSQIAKAQEMARECMAKNYKGC